MNWFPDSPKHSSPLPMVFFTIVKDGMPWITMHYAILAQLPFHWTWHVIEGTAAPTADTSWCAQQLPGLSTDGTTQYLDSIASIDKRLILHRSEMWHGKAAMINTALRWIMNPCLLVELDSDELWTLGQLITLRSLFESNPKATAAYFYCRYFLGPNLAIATRPGFGNHEDYEWLRAWRFKPGQQFLTHEPPVLEGCDLAKAIQHGETERKDLIFDHMAWATEAQVRFKCSYYGSPANKKGHLYTNALEGWHRLQAHRIFPARASDFLPFIEDKSTVDRTVRRLQ